MRPGPHLRLVSMSIILVGALIPLRASAQRADLQFFGDVYIPQRSINETNSTPEDPKIFAGVQELLSSANNNIINFEGAATEAFIPFEMKRYLLKMPLEVGRLLAASGINAATLANNHAMDFGYQGLFDTIWTLNASGIATAGAGRNAQEALTPLILSSGMRTACILPFSRTLPKSFWATASRPGTAYASINDMQKQIQNCVRQGHYTVASFHWGIETSSKPQPYQAQLARLAIDAGAQLVIGHHPHSVQDMEVYKGRPIFYSLGNFAFGSMPADGRHQEGLALRINFTPSGDSRLEIRPLAVRNDVVHYIPRPAKEEEIAALAPGNPEAFGCKTVRGVDKKKRHWKCLFLKDPESTSFGIGSKPSLESPSKAKL